MKTTCKIISTIALSVVIALSGCVKGDKGPKGDTGAQGAQGATGPQGNQGNANVQSATFTVSASSWVISPPSYYATINYSAITQSIVNTGAVLVYWSNGSGGYSQLPLTYYPTASYSRNMEPVSYNGGVNIWVYDSDLTQTIAPGTQVYKIVVIASNYMKPGVNHDNYNEVKQAYNLQD